MNIPKASQTFMEDMCSNISIVRRLNFFQRQSQAFIFWKLKLPVILKATGQC